MVNWIKLIKCEPDTITWKLKLIPKLRYVNVSFSQEGEDTILHALGVAKNGFYVDVGCYHPFRLSNTYRLYLEGWRGMNIDLSKESIKLFNKHRPKDINVCAAVSDVKELVEVKYCGDSDLNPMNSIVPDFCKEDEGRKGVSKESFMSVTLNELFLKYRIFNIDFLNVDCEGADLKILKGINWLFVKPKVIAVESVLGSEIDLFLKSKGYVLVAKTPLTSFYKLVK